MTGTINVLFLQSQGWFGADSVIHAHLMRYLDRGRFTVHVACTAGDGFGVPPALTTIRAIPEVRVRPTHFAPGLRQRDAATVLRGAAAAAAFPIDFAGLCRYVARERIHVIHGTDRPRDSAYAVTLAKLTRRRSVVHVHVKWSNEYSPPARWAVRRADGVFAISRYVAGTVVAMGTEPERVHTVLNCVDPTQWNPAADGTQVRREFGISPETPLVAAVSRLFSWKGHRELIRALPLVRAEVPGTKLLIVGADAAHLRGRSFTDELRELSIELGLGEAVVFTGARSDIPEVMAACDVFALPSFEEPFGLVFLEAMAMMRPVVAIDNGGTPEVVEHGRTGLLSPPWDVERLAANTTTLLKNAELRREMGERGRARVLEYFNPTRMAADAARAYDAVLGRRGAL